MEEKLRRIINEKKALVRSLRKELQYMKPGKLHIKKLMVRCIFMSIPIEKNFQLQEILCA